MRRLHLGCGTDHRSGYVNFDLVLAIRPDVVGDLEAALPFRDGAFDEVLALHVVEHVERFMELVAELGRVCRPGARITIVVPHLSFFGAYTDPTHRRFFGYHSFDYFTEDGVYNFYSPTRFHIRRRQIRFFWIKNQRRETPSRLLTFLINIWPLFYERFLCWMLPANEILFELEPRPTRPSDRTP